MVRDCLFVIPKYAYFAAGLYILEVVSLSASWDAGVSRQLCSSNLQPVPPPALQGRDILSQIIVVPDFNFQNMAAAARFGQ